MTDETLLGRIVWYELLTTDMKAAEAFYTAVVGWSTTPFEGAGQPYDMFNKADGSPVAGVMHIPAGMNFPPHWEMYVGVPVLEDAVARIEQHGGSALSEVIEVPGIGRMRTMRDPQGAVFAIHEAASSVPPEAAPTTGDGAWHELYTTDGAAAKTFYQQVFGWTDTGAFDMGPMGTYYMFGRAWPLGGIMTKTPDMAQLPTQWTPYFRVDDVHGGAERITSHGGQVLQGPMEVPGGDWIVQAVDPQGAAFALHQVAKAAA